MRTLLSLIALIPTLLFAQTADPTWYTDPNATEYSISSGGQLKYLAELVNQSTPVNFSGKTIKLTANITLTDA
jgi:hypothetical protein